MLFPVVTASASPALAPSKDWLLPEHDFFPFDADNFEEI
jgi:hypothetical protein